MFEALLKDSPAVEELLSEHDVSNEDLIELYADLDASYAEMSGLEDLSTTIDDLEQLKANIVEYGVTKSLLAFTNRGQLLSSAMPTFGACEALGADVAVEAAETVAALEELDKTTSDAKAGWFSRMWSFLASFGAKAISAGKMVGSKVAAMGKAIKNGAFNAARATENVIKAHPIASVLAAASLAVACSGLVGVLWGGAFPETQVALTAFMSTAQSKVSAVFVKAGLKAAPTTISGEGFTTVMSGPASKLGFNESTCTDLVVYTGKITEGPESFFTKVSSIMNGAAKTAFEKVKSATGEGATFMRQAYNFLMKYTMTIWRFVSGRTMSVIMSGLSVVKGLFTTKPAEPPHVIGQAGRAAA